MSHRAITATLALALVLAFCTPAVPKSLDLIQNERVKTYTANEIEWGAPSLPVTSKTLYREALELLESGDREGAIERLRLSADLTGGYAAPLFTLSRVELLAGNPAFLPDFVEGAKRLVLGYPSQGILAANLAALVAFSLVGALLATLVALLARHWRFISHSVVEIYPKRILFPPGRWIVGIVIVGLLFMRLGLALYVAILVVGLWAYLGRREKGIVLSLVVLLSAASFSARYANCFAPAIDPQSVTRRLALVNESAVDNESIGLIRGVSGDRYLADRDFALGTMMYRLGLYEEAQKRFLESVSKRPDFASAFLNLGNVYFMQGDYDKAIAGYRSAVELDSASAVAHYNLGQTYIKKMLFAQSGSWLERATLLGIESYREDHPAVSLRNPPVYEQGFDAGALRAIAAAEGRERRNVLLSEMLQPYLLFPFHRLWMLLAASLAIGMIAAWRRSSAWRIERCDNCGGATCSRCEDTQTGIRLCGECAGVIRGLTSAKVMEALLRNKRPKTAGRSEAPRVLRMLLFPGVAHTYYGKIVSGCALSLVGAGALAMLVWRGFYFKDPRAAGLPGSIGMLLAPAAALACAWLLSNLAKPSQEPRNYRILPPDLKMPDEKPASTHTAETDDPWKEYQAARAAKEARFAENATARESATTPEAGKAPAAAKTPAYAKTAEPARRTSAPATGGAPATTRTREEAIAGGIEKGSKWH